MRFTENFNLDNSIIFKQNNEQTNSFITNDMILLQYNIYEDYDVNENYNINLPFLNTFDSVKIKLAQIIDVDVSNLTYQSLYNQFSTLDSNVFLTSKTIKVTTSETISLNISNFNLDAIINTHRKLNVVLFFEFCSEPCELDVQNISLSRSYTKMFTNDTYLPIDENNVFKLNIINGSTTFNDTVYVYHNDLIDFPITFGQIHAEAPFVSTNSFINSFSLNFEGYVDYGYVKNINHEYVLKHIDFFNNTGTYKTFQLLDDLDDETKEKIDNIKTQQVNEVRQQLHDWNKKTYGNDQEIFDYNEELINNLNIASTFYMAKNYETSSFMQDYSIQIENEHLGYLTIYENDGTIFLYTKYGSDNVEDRFLHLCKVIYPNGKSISFENTMYEDASYSHSYYYKTTKILTGNSDDDIELTYGNGDNTSSDSIINTIDFKNHYRKVEFDTISEIDDSLNHFSGVEYKVIDYQNANDWKILKHIRVYWSENRIVQVDDVLANISYCVCENVDNQNEYKIKKYFGIYRIYRGKILLSSKTCVLEHNNIFITDLINDDETITDLINNDKTIYLLDKYQNIKEIIHNNKERISYTYNDYDLPINISTSKLTNREIQNNYFKDRFKYWTINKATFVLRNSNVGSNYIKVKAQSSLAQTLNLEVNHRYEFRGHIKPITLNVYGALSIVGGYNILNGDTLEWHDINIRHEIDITKNDWYYFNTDGFYIPTNATDIELYLVVETGGDLYIDYLVLTDDDGNNHINNYDFDNQLEGWDYSIKPDFYENPDSGYYVRVDEGGSLLQSLSLISGNTYILRGLIKMQIPSSTSTSSIELNVSYQTDEEHHEIRTIILNHNINGWYEFTSEPLEIPINATQIVGEVKLLSNDVVYVKELNISNDNIKYSNLIENGIFQNGQNDINTDPISSNNKFIVSDSNIIVIPSNPDIDKCSIYGNNVLKIYGERHNSYSPRTVYREINTSGKKGDVINASVLIKYNESTKEKLNFFIKVYDNTNNYEEYKVNPTPNFKYYQLLTNQIITKNNYQKIIIGISYTGLNDIFVTGFELYKNNNASSYSYDDLLNMVKKDESIIIYDDNLRVKKVIDHRGQVNILKYDQCHIIKQSDLYGNVYYADYQDSRKTNEEYRFVDDETLSNKYEYDDDVETNDRLMVTFINEFNNKTSYLYDYLYRVKEITSPNEHTITNTYNNMDQLTKVESNIQTSYQNILNYDTNNKLKSIIPGNGTNSNDNVAYQYKYDSLKRISEISFYDNILYKYTYNNKGLVETLQVNDCIYKYTYDNRRRVIEVKYSMNITQPSYSPYKEVIYDKFNNIMYIKDCNKNTIDCNKKTIIHYEYDIQNWLNKVSKLYTNEIVNYTYDDYNNIITKSFNKQVSYDKINYFNKIDNENINEKKSLTELINDYNVEIINASLFDEGLFGISSNKNYSLDIAYDANINKKIISFKQDKRYTSYSLKTWNEDRLINVDSGSTKKLKYMQTDFDYNKTFAFWVRPIDSFSQTTLMKIDVVNYSGNSTQDDIRLIINENGSVSLINNNINHIISDNSLLLNKWNFVSISFIKDEAEDIVTYRLCVNNSIKSVLAPLTFSIIYMNTIRIGEEKNNLDRTMCFDIALITIDSHNHDNTSLNKLRDYTEAIALNKNEKQVGFDININGKRHKYVLEYNMSGKMTSRKFYLNEDGKYTKAYTYNKTQITNENNGKMSYSYTYDNMGNIATRTIKNEESGKIYDINTYSYDKLGRLSKQVRELYNYTDTSSVTTITYDYDENGNIKNRKNYNSLTINDNYLKLEYRYSYDDTYKDKLESVDKILNRTNNNSFKTIEYSNNSLYPSKINGVSLTWNKGKLTSYGNNTYEYNLFGQRTKKTTQTHIHEYTYDDNLLIKEKITNNSNNQVVVLEYIYDQQNILIGVVENNNVYYYDRDITGEIRGLIDTNGNYVIKYYYTAFGEVTKDPNNITNFNPFLYKGYYYDEETHLFYCNSRYYSPELCRFISPDDVEYLDPESINGLNLYAYCGNDPINRYDPSGHAWDVIFDIFSIGWSLYDFIKDPSWENFGWLALDVVFAVVPFLTGSSIMKAASKLDDLSDIVGYMNKFDNVYDSIVIGNDMGRVTNLAFDTGSMIYDGYKPMNALYAMGRADEITDAMRYAAKVDNARFIMDKYKAGYKIINAGSDGRGFFKMMKSAYGMELKILYRLKYGNKLHKLWWILNSGRRIIW